MQREPVGRPMEILLVEDSLLAAKIAIAALKQSGVDHRLTWLSDGDDAARFISRTGQYARAPHPDLILLDLMLPGRSGRELLADIRQDAELRSTPVIIMTGTTTEQPALGAEGLDVQGFLTKPVDLSRFLALIDQLRDYWKADMILPGHIDRE